MRLWSYKTLSVENGMAELDEGNGDPGQIALASALRLYGAQGYELVTVVPDGSKISHKPRHLFIFKRLDGEIAG